MATHLQSSSSPNKCPKTLTPNPVSPSYVSKGKSIVEEDESAADCCGICLSEAGSGGVSRGYIDSCNHYYCFVCIMEWAKVESKCPLCKRRFSAIRRAPKPPIFTSERIVHVPVRDQVYHYFGNATIGPPDPYSEIKCGICHAIADESLLLLCDLCDSAAHTYCVGLGMTVPEGDWFCQDCTLLRDEHLKSESNTYSGIQMSFGTVHQISSINEHVSISDIVQESSGQEVQRSRSISSDPCHLRPPSSTDDETIMINNITRSSSRSQEIAAQHPTKPNTRTLQHCRNLHDRIRVLRENWNGFRSGNLCFSSSSGDGNVLSQESLTCKSRQYSQQSIAQCCSSDITNNIGAHQIQKAWKMMDKAKSIKQENERSSIVRQASKIPIRKLNAIRNADYISHRHLSTDSQQNGAKSVGNMLPGQHLYCSLDKDRYKQPSLVSGKGNWKRDVAKDVIHDKGAASGRWKRDVAKDVIHDEGAVCGHSPTDQELKSSKGVQTPSYPYNASMRSEKPPAEKILKAPDCLSLSAVPESVVLNIDQVKGVDHASPSHGKDKHPEEKSKLKKIYIDSQQYNAAKSEIQSLVKLNLKLQTKGEKLEIDAFKEVARLATHSILAACGLEHPRPGCCSIPGFICSHPNDIRQLQKSSLMPNSCRECFYIFVKDVVNNVMLDKKRT